MKDGFDCTTGIEQVSAWRNKGRGREGREREGEGEGMGEERGDRLCHVLVYEV